MKGIGRIPVVTLLFALLTTEVMGASVEGANLHCHCIHTESKAIGRHIKRFRVIQANAHCPDREIIATLKGSDEMVCLNPNAPWVQRILERYINMKKP